MTAGLSANSGFSAIPASTFDIAAFFYSDILTKRLTLNSSKELTVSNNSTAYADLEWEYQLNNDSTWVSSNKRNLDITYGDKVTAVRVSFNGTVIADWKDGGTNSGSNYNFKFYGNTSTPYSSIENVGSYSFMTDTLNSIFAGLITTGYTIPFPASFTVNIKPKGIRVNLIDKGGEYGTAVKDLYAEEDVLDGDGQPTGAKSSRK